MQFIPTLAGKKPRAFNGLSKREWETIGFQKSLCFPLISITKKHPGSKKGCFFEIEPGCFFEIVPGFFLKLNLDVVQKKDVFLKLLPFGKEKGKTSVF